MSKIPPGKENHDITTVSKNWPRLINNRATNSLVYGCQKDLREIDEEAVQQASLKISM